MKILLFVLAAFIIFSAAILVALSIVAGSAVGIIVGLAVMVGVIATCYVVEQVENDLQILDAGALQSVEVEDISASSDLAHDDLLGRTCWLGSFFFCSHSDSFCV